MPKPSSSSAAKLPTSAPLNFVEVDLAPPVWDVSNRHSTT